MRKSHTTENETQTSLRGRSGSMDCASNRQVTGVCTTGKKIRHKNPIIHVTLNIIEVSRENFCKIQNYICSKTKPRKKVKMETKKKKKKYLVNELLDGSLARRGGVCRRLRDDGHRLGIGNWGFGMRERERERRESVVTNMISELENTVERVSTVMSLYSYLSEWKRGSEFKRDN